MCTYGGRCEVLCDEGELLDAREFLRELFLGIPGESDDERAARQAVARDVLAELLEEGASDALAREDAVCALWLGGVALLRNSRLSGRPMWFGEAA
ncbi:hypothetical protein [Streptomyces sp. CBMA29]|uniref:hypothetical protein n=1 Tax=Streptomyces sp. CBMA29 TaxID=1896314 RepID=UPI001661E6F5|nr:hypothetical protein [Streptomyces sp. CBMA29]MBD0736183.1 hypothetical protein [Streptomyces sp. CBMA29]